MLRSKQQNNKEREIKQHYTIGKHRALSREVTCQFRLYLKIGLTSVKTR